MDTGISKSEVSRICADLDAERSRRFAPARWRIRSSEHVFADSTFCKVRISTHVVFHAMVVATGVSVDGTREVLGTAVGDSESYEFWSDFLCSSLKARGLTGVHLVISDAHAGLKAAVAQQFVGAAWQRCRVHFMLGPARRCRVQARRCSDRRREDDLRPHRPRRCGRPMDQVADTFAGSFPKATAMMREAKTDVLAFTAFPKGHWQEIWSNNPIERLNKEIQRRADVGEIFPNPAPFLRLATSVVIDQHDEWQVGRHYLLGDLDGRPPSRHSGQPTRPRRQ